MLDIVISPFVFASFMWRRYEAKKFDLLYTPDRTPPQFKQYLRTSCDSVCAGTFFPFVDETFPDSLLSIVSGHQPPVPCHITLQSSPPRPAEVQEHPRVEAAENGDRFLFKGETELVVEIVREDGERVPFFTSTYQSRSWLPLPKPAPGHDGTGPLRLTEQFELDTFRV